MDTKVSGFRRFWDGLIMPASLRHLDAKDMYRRAFDLAWPAALEGALLSIIGTVDTVMVKSVHKYAIASVNLTSQPRMILLILAQALCVGTTALVSRRRGENDREGANEALSLSMLLITLVGIVMGLLGYLFAGPIIRLAGGDGDTTQMAVDYFQIICLGLPFNCWSLCLCAALRATGNTRITMVTNVSANLVNVVMNYCLIGGHILVRRPLGVRGAAIATVIGTFVGFLIALYMVTLKKGYLRLRLRLWGYRIQTLKSLLSVGLSSVIESAALRVGFFINNKLIAGINADALTSHTIVSQVTNLSFCLGDGVAAAGATLVGTSLGEKNRDKARGYTAVCLRLGYVTSAFLILVLFFGRKGFSQIFTDDPTIISGTAWAFIVLLAGILPQNIRVIYSGCLRGAGDVKYVALCALLSVSVLRTSLTYLFSYLLQDSFPMLLPAYTGPWLSFVLDAWVRTLLLIKRVNSGKYLDIRL